MRPNAMKHLRSAVVLAILAGSLIPATSASAASFRATSKRIVTGDLYDTSFPSAAAGWAVGAAGVVMRTGDGGSTWARQTSGTGVALRAVDFVDLTRGWAVGDGDTIVRTTDGGTTWRAASSGTGAAFLDVDFTDALHGWAVGATAFLVNVVVATSDGGVTWQPQSAPEGIGLVGVSFADAQRGFITGYSGAAYRTGDGGTTWIPMVVTNDNAVSLYTVSRSGPGGSIGLAAGFPGITYRSVDGGVAWTRVTTFGSFATPNAVRRVAVSGASAVLVGDRGLLAESEDAGATWNPVVTTVSSDLLGVGSGSPSTAMAVGRLGQAVTLLRGAAPLPVPLDLTDDLLSCTRMKVRWTDRAAGVSITAIAVDIDGDGQDEVITAGPQGITALRPFAPSSAAMIWRRPVSTRFQQIVVAELDGDPGVELVATASYSQSVARDGVLALNGEDGTPLWSARVAGGAPNVRAGDLDGDGLDEVVVASTTRHIMTLSGVDGSLVRLSSRAEDLLTDLELADLTGDGNADIVAVSLDGAVRVIDGPSGTTVWSYVADGEFLALAIGDLNGDGTPDVVAAGNGESVSVAHGASADLSVGSRSGGLVAALDGATGARLWDHGDSSPGFVFRAAAIGDLDGDGKADVAVHGSDFDQGFIVALAGRGVETEGRPSGEPSTLFVSEVTFGSGIQSAFGPQALTLMRADGDAALDPMAVSWSGALSAVVDRTPLNPVGMPRVAPTWVFDRTPGESAIMYSVDALRRGGRDLVLAAGGDSLLAVLEPATGARLWSFDGGAYPDLRATDLDGDPASELTVGSWAGRLRALDGSGAPLGGESFFDQRVVPSAVAASGGREAFLVGASVDGTVRAVDPRSSRVLWESHVPSRVVSVTAGSGVAVVGTTDGVVIGLDTVTGAQKWTSNLGSGRVLTSYLPQTSLFVAGSGAGIVRFIEPGGTVRSQASLGAGVTAITGADVDGDGTPEAAVAAGTLLRVLTAGGAVVSEARAPKFIIHLAAGDHDGDGDDELVAGTVLSFAGDAMAFDGRTGAELWRIDNGYSGGVAFMDLEGDGAAEAVVGGELTGSVRVISSDGIVQASCGQRFDSPHALEAGDFDGDGFEEVAVAMSSGSISVIEPLVARGGPTSGSALAIDSPVEATSVRPPVSIVGRTAPGAQVRISEGGIQIATTTADAAGLFAATSPLTDGPHTVSVYAVAGSWVSPTMQRSFIVDGVAPTPPSIRAPASGEVFGGSSVTFAGSAEPGAVVTVSEGAAAIGSGSAAHNGNWSFVAVLASGEHTVTAVAADAAGNRSVSTLRTFMIDLTLPAPPTISSPREFEALRVADVALSGTAPAGSTVRLETTAGLIGRAQVDAEGGWALPHTFADGTTTVRAVTEAGGRQSVAVQRTFTIDTAAPSAPSVQTPTTGATLRSSLVQFTGRADPGSLVTVRRGSTALVSAPTYGDGTFALSYRLADGAHDLSLDATDAAGNIGVRVAVPFVVDTRPQILGPDADAVVGQSVAVRGTAAPSASVSLWEADVRIASGAADASGAFAIDVELRDGPHSVRARATSQGFTSALSVARTFVVDGQAPTVHITTAENALVLAGTSVVGTAEDGYGLAFVRVQYRSPSGRVVWTGPATCACSGTTDEWSHIPDLLPGWYAVVVNAVDLAGNVSAQRSRHIIVV